MPSATGAETMHVGIDATTWWNERGFGRFTRELVRALARRAESGQCPYRYSLVVDRPPDESLPDNVEVVVARAQKSITQAAVGKGSRSVGDLYAMARVAANHAFDVFFFPAVYSYFPLLSRTPTVVAFHDTIAERYPDLVFPTQRNRRLWMAKCLMAKLQAKRIMTVSKASANDLERFWNVSPLDLDIITEAADPMFRAYDASEPHAELRARLKIPPQAKLLVYVGGLNPHKTLMTLLKAMPQIIESQPDAHLAIVGDISGKGFYDNYQELNQFVSQNPLLESRVHFTGYISDEDLIVIYNGAAALVFPSLWEGFGLPAVEAMACGLPVFASRRGSLPEVVGDAGVFFDPLSEDAIARAVSVGLSDPAELQRLSERALARAATFTWDRGAELAEQSFSRCME